MGWSENRDGAAQKELSWQRSWAGGSCAKWKMEAMVVLEEQVKVSPTVVMCLPAGFVGARGPLQGRDQGTGQYFEGAVYEHWQGEPQQEGRRHWLWGACLADPRWALAEPCSGGWWLL
jgi:hypothetical protein